MTATEETASLSVSVIIPTFKRIDLLPRCIEGVEALRPRPFEIIVSYRPIDDPGTARWLEDNLRDHPLWKLVILDRPGQVQAINAGIDVAQGDILAIFDDDAVPHTDWLEKILGHFCDESVGAAGGRDVVFSGDGSPILLPATAKAGYRDFWGEIRGAHHLVVGSSRIVETVKGCNWAIRKKSLGSLRLDERLPGIGAQPANDYWLCLNLRHAGWKIILDPSAKVDHFPAYKPDYAHGTFPRLKCFEWTANGVAAAMAFASPSLRLRNIIYHLFWGERHCPGLYFVIHSLVKRPKSLPGQLIGGWSGYLAGLRMAREFGRSPPGVPSPPPKIASTAVGTCERV